MVPVNLRTCKAQSEAGMPRTDAWETGVGVDALHHRGCQGNPIRTSLCTKQVTNEDRLYGTRSSAQGSVVA